MKTKYHNDGSVFGYHVIIDAGLYHAIGFTFDSATTALARACERLYKLVEKNEGTESANAFYQNIHLMSY